MEPRSYKTNLAVGLLLLSCVHSAYAEVIKFNLTADIASIPRRLQARFPDLLISSGQAAKISFSVDTSLDLDINPNSLIDEYRAITEFSFSTPNYVTHGNAGSVIVNSNNSSVQVSFNLDFSEGGVATPLNESNTLSPTSLIGLSLWSEDTVASNSLTDELFDRNFLVPSSTSLTLGASPFIAASLNNVVLQEMSVTPVPLPSALLFFASGLAGLVVKRKWN